MACVLVRVRVHNLGLFFTEHAYGRNVAFWRSVKESINREVRCATWYADENRSSWERAGTKGSGHVLHLYYLSAVGKYLRKLFVDNTHQDLNCQHLTHSINFLVEHQGIGDDDLQSELFLGRHSSVSQNLSCMHGNHVLSLLSASSRQSDLPGQNSLVSFCGVFSRFFYVWFCC